MAIKRKEPESIAAQACQEHMDALRAAEQQDAQLGTEATAYRRLYHQQYVNDLIREVKRERGLPVQADPFVLPWLRTGGRS